MEYTEEEKKAIEFFEKRQKYMGDYRGPLEENTDIVLNLIDKQQKEIDILEKESISKEKAYTDCYCEYKSYKQFESISKEAIREKIEELYKLIIENDKLIVECRKTIMENQPEKKIKIAKARMDNVMYYEMINYLKELLGVD